MTAGLRRVHRGRRAGAAAAVTLAALASSSCGSPARPTVDLADGSVPPSLPPELHKLGSGAVLTRVRIVRPAALTRRERACVRATSGSGLRHGERLVERIDAYGRSLTFRIRGSRYVYGCTSSDGQTARAGWCGHVVGELRAGRLLDPRLDIACRDPRGLPWGSMWIEPVTGARWIAARDDRIVQVYRAAGSLPIRVTTGSVDTAAATAECRIEQYDGSGALISTSTLRAAVAG